MRQYNAPLEGRVPLIPISLGTRGPKTLSGDTSLGRNQGFPKEQHPPCIRLRLTPEQPPPEPLGALGLQLLAQAFVLFPEPPGLLLDGGLGLLGEFQAGAILRGPGSLIGQPLGKFLHGFGDTFRDLFRRTFAEASHVPFGYPPCSQGIKGVDAYVPCTAHPFPFYLTL